MQVLITGADGFIGRNLSSAFQKTGINVVTVTRTTSPADLALAAQRCDAVVHLAGINRPRPNETYSDNARITAELIEALTAAKKSVPVLYSSSTQVERANDYGNSKKQAEELLQEYGRSNASPVYIYRLPNVFGPGARPDYNSAVATFCHRIARNESIEIHDAAAVVTLVYIEDVIASFLKTLQNGATPGFLAVAPTYQISVGDMARQIQSFHSGKRDTLPGVNPALANALYNTYLSAVEKPQEAYAQNT